MATVDPQLVEDAGGYWVFEWANLASDDDGDQIKIKPYFLKMTAQIQGTAGGATPVLEGSMDGSNWETLTSDGTTATSGTGLYNVYEAPLYIRPNVNNGDSTTDLTFRLGIAAEAS